MGYEGVYLMLQKKLRIPYWRYIAHVFMVCKSGNKGTFDMLNTEQSLAFVALTMNWGYNFSKFILNEMKGNLKGNKSERFMMYPRFLQVIFDEKFSVLLKGAVTQDLKLLSEYTFPLVMQNRGGKYKFEGLHPLKKFGQFAEIEEGDVKAVEIPIAFIEEENDIEVMNSRPSDEDVYVVKLLEYEDVVTGEEPDMDFDFKWRQYLLRMILLSKETRILDDKGKNVLPEEEPIDTVKLQSRIFELEQDSLSHTLLIQELKSDNELKDKKIEDHEKNMRHLSAIVLDLK
ncbi:hypothetical protein R6Q57_005704 [Mikania cordata]